MTEKHEASEIQDTHDLIEQRRSKLSKWRQEGHAYPTDFRRNALAKDILDQFQDKNEAELESHPTIVSVAGRIMTRRLMGKASFVHLQDMSGRIQLYIRQDDVTAHIYDAFKEWDLGDIIGAEGVLFKTKTGELSVKIKKLCLLTKSIRPLPDKYHGLSDQETKYRQRYLDLIANDET